MNEVRATHQGPQDAPDALGRRFNLVSYFVLRDLPNAALRVGLRTAGSFAPRSDAVLVKPSNPYDVSTMAPRQ